MIRKRLDILLLLFDVLVIISPFLLLFDGGIQNFVYIFYLVYFPSLILHFIKNKIGNNIKSPRKNYKKEEKYFEIY